MDKPKLIYGLATDHAHTREANQDASSVLLMTGVSDAGAQDVGLFIVADGTSGQNDQESAPAVAIRTVVREVTSQFFEPLMQNMGNYDVPIRTVLANAFLAANQRLFDHPAYGVTAMTAALVNGTTAYIAHVGDTSAHAITPDAVSPLTTMHHLAHRLVEKGQATWDEINQNQVDVTNVLYRAIGRSESLEVDVITYQLDRNRQLLLCSDGLSGWNWEQVTKNDVNGIMLSAYDLQYACNRLVSLAQEHETFDAVTAIMIGLAGQ